jgi:sugar/nucleoside kinase (ribokinase family)
LILKIIKRGNLVELESDFKFSVVERPPLDVVVVGAIGIDTNVYLGKDEIDFTVEANFSQNLDYVGGAGGYSCRGFARLGYRTGFIGAVGDDHNGRLIGEEIQGDKIETLFFIDPKGSRRSVNIMYRDGRRKNFYDGKGSMDLQPDLDQCREFLKKCRAGALVHFSIENWARYLLPLAKELGLTVSCDLQDLVSIEDSYRQDFIKAADILFFSAANQADPTPWLEKLLADRPGLIIVVGRGGQGCALATREETKFFGPVQLDEPVIDTNGAGDGLAVGFLASRYLDRGFSLEEAILRGQLVARYTCTQKATSSHLITRARLDDFYDRAKPAGTLLRP